MKFSVNQAPPEVVKQVRLLHEQGADPKPPFHKVEERKGTGKATCRSCGELIKEGDPTVFFEHSGDAERPWLRTRGTIHAEDCGDFSKDWVKCPKCKEQLPNEKWSEHWREHKYDKGKAASIELGPMGTDYWPGPGPSPITGATELVSITPGTTLTQTSTRSNSNSTNSNVTSTTNLDPGVQWSWTGRGAFSTIDVVEAASNARQVGVRDAVLAKLRPQDVPSYYDPEATKFETPDGWKVAQITTMGDALYEGRMLNHCLANDDIHQMMRNQYELGEDDNSGEFFFPPPPPAYAFEQHFPNASEEFKEHVNSRAFSRIMSLRDPNGIPKATWWEPKESPEGTEVREVAGFDNQPIKNKHAHRILQYMRGGLEGAGKSSGKLEHCGVMPEGTEDLMAFQYAPIQEVHVHDLPKKDEQYGGQVYDSTPTQKVAHCGQCEEDRKGHGKPGKAPRSRKFRVWEKEQEELVENNPANNVGPYMGKSYWMEKLGHVGEDEGAHHLEEFEEEFKPDSELQQAQKAHDTVSRGVESTDKEVPHPGNHEELKKHMREWHMMDRDEMEDLPDVALGLTHEGDHEDYAYGHKHVLPTDELESEFKDNPEVQRDLSEMKGKEIANQIWEGVTDIFGEPPTHCPECGDKDTESKGQKLDEDGWPYEHMQCKGCGKEFPKDEAGSGLNFTQDEPQTYHDEWRQKDRIAHFRGSCLGCGKRTYAFDDGENDPRGPLGNHAASPLHAEDFYKKGPEVPLCFNCANDYDSYKKAQEYGHKIWEDDPSQKQGWKAPRKTPSLDPNAGKPGNVTTQEEVGAEGDTGDSGDSGGYEPRVDPYAGKSVEETKRKQVDQEAAKLQKGMAQFNQTVMGSSDPEATAWDVVDGVGRIKADGDAYDFGGADEANDWRTHNEPDNEWWVVERIAASPFGKELKKVRRALEEQGWTEERTTSGWRFKAPRSQILPDTSNPNGIVVTHESPSDHRAFKNFLSDLRNTTGFAWPPERATRPREEAHDQRACLERQGLGTAGYTDAEVEDLHGIAHEEAS